MFGKLIRKAANAVTTVSKIPVLGQVARAIPGVGAVMAGASLAGTAYNMLNPGGGSSMPALPPMAMSSMPAMPGAGAPAIVGERSVFRNDPNVIESIKPFAIAARNLRQSYRSPIKGYVVVRDSVGDPMAVPKWIARQYFGWKPAKKPPMSVGDWSAIQKADRASKKAKKIMATISRVDNNIKGGKVIIRKKAKCS